MPLQQHTFHVQVFHYQQDSILSVQKSIAKEPNQKWLVSLHAGGLVHSGTLRTGTIGCARAARYRTNAIAVSDFTIVTRKWAKLYELRVRRSVAHSENVILCYTLTLQKGSLLRPAWALPLEISQRESSANRFKLLPISCGCTDNFHMHDNHANVVRSHVLAT